MSIKNEEKDQEVGMKQAIKNPGVAISYLYKVFSYRASKKGIIFFALTCFLPVSANANWIDDLFDKRTYMEKERDEGEMRIVDWNIRNQNLFNMDGATLDCSDGGYGWNGLHDCAISSKISNKTKEKIDYVLIEIRFYNKKSNDLVYSTREALWVSTFPSITQEITHSFENKQMREAINQLSANDGFSWNYCIVGAVPDGMSVEWLAKGENSVGLLDSRFCGFASQKFM